MSPSRTLAALCAFPLVAAAQQTPAPGSPGTAQAAAPGLTWKDLITDPNRIKFYGFVRLDAQYDDSRPNNAQTIGWILSEDPAAPSGGAAPVGANGRNNENFNMHPRLTRFGLDVDGGEIASLGGAKVTGKIEIDFFNNGLAGQSESRAALRMRHAYAKLVWGDVSLLAGQTTDIISPLWPIVNADLVMWGAGNLGDRRPQARLEWAKAMGDSKLTVQTMAGLTGAQDNQNLDANGSTFRDGDTSGRPTLQARVAYSFPLMGQRAEVGVWGHQAWEQTDTAIGASGETDFESDAWGMDASFPLYKDRVTLKGEAWAGKNLDDVRGGIFQGVNTTTGQEIDSTGGFIELGVKTTEHNTLYAGYSNDNPEAGDVVVGGRANNRIAYLASRWNYKPVSIGLEYLNWTTKYVGFDEGTDNRFVAFLAYTF
jgi:hypothetical protein